MRRIATAVLAGLALVLTACAGLPTTGEVNPGLPPGDTGEQPDFAFVPEAPQPGADPEQIVNGFIRAGSGTDDGWATARLYLGQEIQATWQPTAGVTIDRLADRAFESTIEGGLDAETPSTEEAVVTVELAPEATVDEEGAYQLAEGGNTTLTFELGRDDDGEWRITTAPDGIVLYQEVFQSVFASASIAYFDPSGEYLVPDVRWFPRTNIESRVAVALVEGSPSAWLDGAVTSAFPQNVTLDARSVPVVGGIAQVELSASALLLDASTLDRMQTQLQTSLASIGTGAVQMLVGGTALDAQTVATRSTRVDSRPVVETAAGVVGFLSGDDVEEIPGMSGALAAVPAASIVLGADQDVAAVQTDTGTVLRVAATGNVFGLDERPGLLPPTIDAQGYLWSVPRADPAGVRVWGESAQPTDIADAWPGASAISSFQISRDGTRMAAVVTVGGRTQLWAVGVIRDDEGRPVSLSDPIVLADIDGEGLSLAWLDDTTVAVLTTVGDDLVLLEQLVGGPGSTDGAPEGSETVVGGNSSVRVLTDGDVLYIARGSNWQPTAEEIRILAVQQGVPG